MDIDFMLQDTFNLLRPQWKVTTDLSEAGRLFADAVTQNYKSGQTDGGPEQEEADDETLAIDGDDELPAAEADNAGSASDEAEGEMKEPIRSRTQLSSPEPTVNGDQKHDSDFEQEIVVKRQEEERDPEAEAEFDRELAKMMAEGIDSRKFERKQLFDVPLPIRKGLKDQPNADDAQQDSTPIAPNMMAFSLMTKRGNKQQVILNRTDPPSC